MKSGRRTLTLPVVLASLTIPLSIFVLIGWVLVILRNQRLSEEVAADSVLLFSGIISLLIIIVVIIILSVFLGREILEGRQQERFIDSVTHELKSPLAALRLCAQTLNRKDLPNDKKGRLSQMMLHDIDRLDFFIDDILEASRIGHPSLYQNSELINLYSLTKHCCQLVQTRHRVSRDIFSIKVDKSLTVVIPKSGLETVIKNLLDNAIKYSPKGQPIHIQTQIGDQNVTFSVIDNGIGIDPQHQKRIFDRFYRSPSESVRNRSGTGIGLYVAAQVVRSFGSRLQVKSKGINKGSIFSFTIPIENGGNNE
jgi:signal transduction histidine kinase